MRLYSSFCRFFALSLWVPVYYHKHTHIMTWETWRSLLGSSWRKWLSSWSRPMTYICQVFSQTVGGQTMLQLLLEGLTKWNSVTQSFAATWSDFSHASPTFSLTLFPNFLFFSFLENTDVKVIVLKKIHTSMLAPKFIWSLHTVNRRPVYK